MPISILTVAPPPGYAGSPWQPSRLHWLLLDEPHNEPRFSPGTGGNTRDRRRWRRAGLPPLPQ